jgi:hypothetical protein
MNELLIHMNAAVAKTAEAVAEVKNAITVIEVCKGDCEELGAIRKELETQLTALKSLYTYYYAQKVDYLKLTEERRQEIQTIMKQLGKGDGVS